MDSILRASGYNFTFQKIHNTMKGLFPDHMDARKDHQFRQKKHTTPVFAPYFGYQLACDQNEVLRRQDLPHCALTITGMAGICIQHGTRIPGFPSLLSPWKGRIRFKFMRLDSNQL